MRRSFLRPSFAPERSRLTMDLRELEEMRNPQAELSHIADVTRFSIPAAVRPSIGEVQGTNVQNGIHVVPTEAPHLETVEQRVMYSRSRTENIVTENPREVSPKQVENVLTEQLGTVINQSGNVNVEAASGTRSTKRLMYSMRII